MKFHEKHLARLKYNPPDHSYHILLVEVDHVLHSVFTASSKYAIGAKSQFCSVVLKIIIVQMIIGFKGADKIIFVTTCIVIFHTF